MKKSLIVLFALMPFIASAQLKLIAESQPFEEPEDGYGRILALKNGGTAFFHITKKEGIDVRIYNEQHKEIVAKTIEPDYGKLSAPDIEGIYEIDDNIVLFISEIEDKIPTLYRLSLDKKNGNIVELKTIGTLMKTSMGQGYAVVFGGVPIPGFIVRKDPASDNYGAINYNTFESDNTKRVELIQYDGKGQEKARNFLSSPNSKYKYTQIIDFVVVGSDAYVLLYSYNTPTSGGAANELLLATVSGENIYYQNVGKSYAHKIGSGILRYNPVTNNLIFLTIEYIKTESKGFKQKDIYNVQFAMIDPKYPTIKNTIDFRRSSLNTKYRSIFHTDDSYSALPQNLYVNDDGSFTVLLEETTQKTTTTSTGTSNSGVILGTVAMITYAEDGTEKSAVLIPKLQTTTPSMLSSAYRDVESFYIAHRENTAVVLKGGNQYKSIVYLNGKNKRYALLNDVEENEERIKKGKLINIQGVRDCDAYVYDISDASSNIPPRKMIFGKEKRKDHNLAIFNLSDYDRGRDIYTTLKLDDGKVKMVWLSGEGN